MTATEPLGPVRRSGPLERTRCRLPRIEADATERALADANRSAWARSASVVGGLLPGIDVKALAATPPDGCHLATPGPEALVGLLDLDDVSRLLQTELVPVDDTRPAAGFPKLATAGTPAALDTYVHLDGIAQDGRGARLHTYAVSDALRHGGSLYLTTSWTHHPPLARLVEHLRRVLGGSAQCGVFLSHGAAASPFDAHWDATENYGFQLVGRRHWEVRRPSVPDNHPAFGLGRGEGLEVVWEGELEPGDVLVIPKAFWHRVTPIDPGPSLHATVGINRPVAHDALRWLLGTSVTDPSVRAPIGHRETAADGLLDPLRAVLAGPVDDAFLAHLHARELPVATPGVGLFDLLALPDPGGLVVRRQLTGSVALFDTDDEQTVGLAGGGRAVEIDRRYVDAAAAALAGGPVAVADLLGLGPEPGGVVAVVDHLLRIDWCTTARVDDDPLTGG